MNMVMDRIDLDSSVPDCLIDYPQLLPLFQELGIDYCCGGKSLLAAFRERGLNPDDMLTQCDAFLGVQSDQAPQKKSGILNTLLLQVALNSYAKV